MCRINKEDYFVGVFVSMVLKSKGAPALFDATGKNKRVEFATDVGNFNVYVKYSTGLKNEPKIINGKRKHKMSCNISFSTTDYDYLKNTFPIEGKENMMCLVCTNKELNETKMALVKYEDAMKCLKHQTKSGNRRITVTRIGKEHYFDCYGGRNKSSEHIKCPVDYTNFLGLAK